MQRVSETLLSWASQIDDGTLAQAEAISRLPIIAGHVALMPDAHLGIGSTVGSVIPTAGAVIPAAIGVDIGCGMVAALLARSASSLPDDLGSFVRALERAVPAGLGKWHQEASPEAAAWWSGRPATGTELTTAQVNRALAQLGTMGSGNHFFELTLDQTDQVWIIMHSGSRGIGNQLAQKHIGRAREVCTYDLLAIRGSRQDLDLAWLEEGTRAFREYIADMRFAQSYAKQNRRMMMRAATQAFEETCGAAEVLLEVNCHHNFTEQETWGGKRIWVTRKGAIRAKAGELALIPGSMGGKSYVVRGLGAPLSYASAAHGAGRRFSRTKARQTLSVESLQRAMEGRAWQADKARELLDEHPDAYKDIDLVMEDQRDLVEVLFELRSVANYKGTS